MPSLSPTRSSSEAIASLERLPAGRAASAAGRRSARWAKTSFSSSSERPSRTCSTGSGSHSATAAWPAGVARKIVRFGPARARLVPGRDDQPALLEDLERAVDERAASATRSSRARRSGESCLANAQPCAGRSQSRASTAHSPGARSRSLTIRNYGASLPIGFPVRRRHQRTVPASPPKAAKTA